MNHLALVALFALIFAELPPSSAPGAAGLPDLLQRGSLAGVSHIVDCLPPIPAASQDTLGMALGRRTAARAFDLTRPRTEPDSGALGLIGQYIDRCIGSRRELFVAQKVRIRGDSQTFVVRRRPGGPDAIRTVASPEASTYLITLDSRLMAILKVREFR